MSNGGKVRTLSKAKRERLLRVFRAYARRHDKLWDADLRLMGEFESAEYGLAYDDPGDPTGPPRCFAIDEELEQAYFEARIRIDPEEYNGSLDDDDLQRRWKNFKESHERFSGKEIK